MCVVSMIYDHYNDRWGEYLDKMREHQRAWPSSPPYLQPQPAINTDEIDEFRKLLDRAREYDKRNNEPDCELESKKQKLLQLAKELGAKVDFLNGSTT